jgi:hypothetical protein
MWLMKLGHISDICMNGGFIEVYIAWETGVHKNNYFILFVLHAELLHNS